MRQAFRSLKGELRYGRKHHELPMPGLYRPAAVRQRQRKLCCDYCGSTYDVAQVEALYGEKQARADKAAEAAEKRRPAALSGGDGDRRSQQPHLHFLRCRAGLRPRDSRHHLSLLRQPHRAGRTAFRQAQAGKYIIPFRMDKRPPSRTLRSIIRAKPSSPKPSKSPTTSGDPGRVCAVLALRWPDGGRGAYKAEISESHREGAITLSPPPGTSTWPARGRRRLCPGAGGRSSKMPDAHMDAIGPFDYSDLKPLLHGLPARLWQTGTTRTTRSVVAQVLTR